MRLIFLLLPLLAVAQPASLKSGDYAVQFSAQDVSGWKMGKQVLSMRARQTPEFDEFRRDMPKDMRPCSWEKTTEVFSLAGPYLGMRVESYSFCKQAAHPNVDRANITYDLRTAGKPVPITIIFPEADVVAALMKDNVLAPHLKAKPANLEALARALPADGVAAGSTPCRYSLDDDFHQFAIHHVEKGQVAVRITLNPIGPPCQAVFAELGILLPVPEELKQAVIAVPPARSVKAKVTLEAK